MFSLHVFTRCFYGKAKLGNESVHFPLLSVVVHYRIFMSEKISLTSGHIGKDPSSCGFPRISLMHALNIED